MQSILNNKKVQKTERINEYIKLKINKFLNLLEVTIFPEQ